MAELSITASVAEEDRAAIVRDVVDAIRPLLSQRQSLVDGDELAKLLGVSRPTVDRLRRDGVIPSILIGTRRLYRPDAVIETLERQEVHHVD